MTCDVKDFFEDISDLIFFHPSNFEHNTFLFLGKFNLYLSLSIKKHSEIKDQLFQSSLLINSLIDQQVVENVQDFKDKCTDVLWCQTLRRRQHQSVPSPFCDWTIVPTTDGADGH